MPDVNDLFNYKDHRNAYCILSEQTASDLGLDDLFAFVDHTSSKVGQQYLYDLIRTIPGPENGICNYEPLIRKLSEQESLRTRLAKLLAPLDKYEGYSLVSLIYREPPLFTSRRKYVFQLLGLLPALMLGLFLVFQSGIFLLLLLAAFLVNLGIHYRNKHYGIEYLASVPLLIKGMGIASKIRQIPLFTELGKELPAALDALKPLKRSSLFIRIENKLDTDLAVFVWAMMEFQHIFFLTEPRAFVRFSTQLKDKKKEIGILCNFIGLTDCLLSVALLRNTLPFYCIPTTAGSACKLGAADLYHPLIENCIPNTFRSGERSFLLTGSNMSGKTTFIRTVGMNVLIAQTLNTAFARSFSLDGPMAVRSALMLADSLNEGKSLYLKEVDTIQEMLVESRKGTRNLFLLDEIFKGTNTTERIASAKAVLAYLNTPGNLIFVSTHDTELASLLDGTYDLYHFCETVQADTLTFDYKLKPGKLTHRNAVRILELKHYPASIIEDAYRTIRTLENQPVSG